MLLGSGVCSSGLELDGQKGGKVFVLPAFLYLSRNEVETRDVHDLDCDHLTGCIHKHARDFFRWILRGVHVVDGGRQGFACVSHRTAMHLQVGLRCQVVLSFSVFRFLQRAFRINAASGFELWRNPPAKTNYELTAGIEACLC